MPTIACEVMDWLAVHPEATPAEKAKLLSDIPAAQWAMPDGYWSELAPHCANHVLIKQEPRFINRLSINVMTPLPRCLYRSPDGRGLAWLKSGGEVEAYGRCEQAHCERAKQAA